MAKRFIDTNLFRKPFMRSLEAPYKALWLYLLCECDHAGIWVVELDVAQMRMGMKLDPEKALGKLSGAVVPIDHGTKWYIVDFVAFQYGRLNPKNRVHASAIEILATHGIDPENKPLISPLQGVKDKDKDKEVTISEKEPAPEDPITWPAWAGPQTVAAWEDFKHYRLTEKKERYKSAKTEQRAVNILAKYFTCGQDCVEALEHSMGKGWLFPVDPTEYKYPTQQEADV